MRTMTIEELLMKEDDATLLNIHDELESGVMPATSYAHEYVRKVNRMINEGKLCVVPGQYRTVYLPTISKLIYKEMASRYATYCYNLKTAVSKPYTGPTVRATRIKRNDVQCTCAWCNCDDFVESDLHDTDLGMLCDQCIEAIRSRGEDLYVYN